MPEPGAIVPFYKFCVKNKTQRGKGYRAIIDLVRQRCKNPDLEIEK